MKILTARLELIAADAALVRAEIDDRSAFAARLDAAVEEWPPPLNSVETAEYAYRYLSTGKSGWMNWYFVTRAPRLAIGCGGFTGEPDPEGMVEVGYSLLPAHQRRGYATEAVNALLDWACADPRVRTLAIETLPSLEASIRVADRLGFQLVGAGSEEGAIRYQRSARSLE